MDRSVVMAAAFRDELEKIARVKHAVKLPSKATLKAVAPLAVGAAGYETLRRANQDRKIGRVMRQQQGQQF